MLSIAKRYVSDHEEAVHQMNAGFAKAMINIGQYQSSEGEFGGWLKRVLVNSIIDHLRKKKRYRDHLQVYSENVLQLTVETSSVNLGVEKLAYEDVLELLAYIPDGTREVFNLFVMDGLKYEEISKLMDIPVGTCKWHVSKARKILMDRINSSEEYRNNYAKKQQEKNIIL